MVENHRLNLRGCVLGVLRVSDGVFQPNHHSHRHVSDRRVLVLIGLGLAVMLHVLLFRAEVVVDHLAVGNNLAEMSQLLDGNAVRLVVRGQLQSLRVVILVVKL